MALQHTLSLAFGLLGNIISLLVFLAPVPTFYTIYKKKTTEGFQALPYVIGLLSSMLYIYYALLKEEINYDATLLITINSVGSVIETLYISLFLFYAPKKARISNATLLFLLNGFSYAVMVVLTRFLATGEMRIKIVGWICLVFSISVFVAPLGVLRQVIRTKSVEFMPFPLSFFLTLGAVAWFFYGFLIKDFYIALPNILGFFLGVVQMVVYVVYKNAKEVLEDQPKGQELSEHIIDVRKISTLVCPEMSPAVILQPTVDITSDMIEVVQNIIIMAEKTEETKEAAMDDDASTKV
ncbi:bidirectional sugar transporter SWEET10-like [Malus sylvestris]|uniref:bidirectional sugar transporter SWEET10-like n=1 Tax=Malus sylvestris TaxID=3752 RepID=UPI0021ACFA0A|nr:bidirectional sugar transporter SWEET10-like [Malus sylvestris]